MSTKPKDHEEKRPHPQHNHEQKEPAAEPAIDPMSTPPDPAPKEDAA